VPEKKVLSAAQLMAYVQQLRGSQETAEEANQLQELAQKGISESDQQRVREIMENKEALQKMLASPQAKALLKKLGGQSS
jgi:mannitol-1-phosphate/altronate dehydrogenase